MSYPSYGGVPAANSSVLDRMTFIRRSYAHLAGAIGLFVALSAAFYSTGVGASIVSWMGQSRYGWLLILGGFMVAGYLGQGLARSRRSLAIQYSGLTIYAVAEAIIFSPLIFIAAKLAPGSLPTAAILTLAAFAGLTGYVLVTQKDFSFMHAGMTLAGVVAMGAIVCSILFGFNLGIWFSGFMVLFASGAVVYSTSNVLRNYPTDQYVAASLDLFAAVALLFWYVLRILMQLQRN